MSYYGYGGQNGMNNGAPYGNSPYGQNPYGNGGYNGYNNGFDRDAYEKKKAGDRRVRTSIFLTSAVLCCGICFYVLLSNLYSVLISSVPTLYANYTGSSAFSTFCDMLYSFVCVGLPFLCIYLFFVFFDKKSADIRFGGVYDKTNTALLIIAGLGLCFIGNVVGSMVINFFGSIGIEFYSYREATSGADVPSGAGEIVLSVIRTAVIPALIEEFAFRGVVLGALRRYGDGFAIGITAVMFGLMHGNFTQVPFAIIAGLALGFICVVTGSIWPSVILHFCNNFISVIYSVIIDSAGSAATAVSLIITNVIIFVGAAAFGVYLIRNRNGLRLRPGPYRTTNGKVLAFILSPTFLLGAGALIKNMLDDIVR